MMGSVMVDEQVFPIIGLRIYREGFRITAEARGPLPCISLTDYTVHGEDGTVVYRSAGREPLTIGPLDEKSSLTFHLNLTINGRTAQPGGPVTLHW
jgi:hypothetical protein